MPGDDGLIARRDEESRRVGGSAAQQTNIGLVPYQETGACEYVSVVVGVRRLVCSYVSKQA